MKIKCTSKRGFKKILNRMINKSEFKITNNEYMFYAADHFNCGIKTFKGYNVRFIPVGYWDFRIGYIYLAPNMCVQTNDLDQQDT